MYRPYYEWRGLNWFFRLMHVIPVAANDPPEKIADSLERARQEIRRGHIVCIFAEGSISRTGNLLKFKRGLERIAGYAHCPIIPVYLDGVWGSIFSFERGRFLFKLPKAAARARDRLYRPGDALLDVGGGGSAGDSAIVGTGLRASQTVATAD
jgi:1-acyl-sn-glycerol-3-phosphate acyltransferase